MEKVGLYRGEGESVCLKVGDYLYSFISVVCLDDDLFRVECNRRPANRDGGIRDLLQW